MSVIKIKKWWEKYAISVLSIFISVCIMFSILANEFGWISFNTFIIIFVVLCFMAGVIVIFAYNAYNKENLPYNKENLFTVYVVEHRYTSVLLGKFYDNEMLGVFKTLSEAQKYIERCNHEVSKITENYYKFEHPHYYTDNTLFIEEYVIHKLTFESPEEEVESSENISENIVHKNDDNWICESCVYYPPSSCDGKPCSICDADSESPITNCYEKREEDV